MRALNTRTVRSIDDRGAILVFMAFAVIAMVGLAALVIDHGHNLAERRRLETATDAAALAAAEQYADGIDGCASGAVDYLQRNADDAALVSCTPHGDTEGGTFGWVVVEAELVVDQFIAGAIGTPQVTVEAQSVAMFGAPRQRPSGGLRPMALCVQALLASPEYQAWVDDGSQSASLPIRITYSKEHPSECGQRVPGNWGFLDFDGGGNSNRDVVDWIRNGYDGAVEPGPVPGNPGALSGSHASALQHLVDEQIQFWTPVFVEGTGNGGNAEFTVVDFIATRLVDFKVNGSQSTRYLEIVIDPRTLAAACCEPPSVLDDGMRVTGLVVLGPAGEPRGVDE